MKPRFNWRHQYDQDRDKAEGEAAALLCEDESLTVQSFARDADLNVIAKRFGLTHPMELAALASGAQFRDTTQDPELQDILDMRHAGKEAFQSLPDKIRKRFHNNPAELLEFLDDQDNREEAIRLGLLNRPANASAPAAAPAQSTESTSAPTGATGASKPETSARATTTETTPKPPQGA